MSLSLFTALLISLTPVHANVKARPQIPSELGFSFEQNAYHVKGKILWIDEAALKRDFPELAPYSSRQIEELILRNFSVVTELQMSLRGSVIEDFTAEPTPRKVYHPSDYTRAGDATFEIPKAGTIPGLVDLKGIGYSPEGMQRVKDFFAPLDRLERKEPIQESDLNWALRKLKMHEEELREITSHVLEKDDPVAVRSRSHSVAQREKRVEIYTFLKSVYEKSLQGQPPRPEDIRAYVELLGKTDYVNGGASTDRLLKEVVIQKAAQKVFDKYNALTNSELQTVENYFVIELPFKIRTPGGGIRSAGIIGRQAHWRFSNVRNFDIPDEVGVFDMLTGRNCQYDVFGAVVDFENVDIKGLGANYSEQIVPTRIREAMNSFFLWRKSAINKLVAQTVTEADGISFDRPLTHKNLLGAEEESFVSEVLNKAKNNILTKEDAKVLQDRNLVGIFVARTIQLIHHDPTAGGALIRNLIGSQWEVSSRTFVETLFSLVQLDTVEFGKVLRMILSNIPKGDDPAEVSPSESLLLWINAMVTLELVKRQAAESGILHQKLWFSPESIPFMFLTLWVDQYLKNGPEDHGFDGVLNAVVADFPEEAQKKFLAIVENTMKIYEGKARLGTPGAVSCGTLLAHEAPKNPIE